MEDVGGRFLARVEKTVPVGTEPRLLMNISAIVPTWNEAERLPSLLPRLFAGKDVFEVIVADNCSTDGTREIASELGARVVPGGLPAAGRNAGAKAATGTLLLFVDADMEPQPEHFEALVDSFQSPTSNLVFFRCATNTRMLAGRVYFSLEDIFVRCAHAVRTDVGTARLLAVRSRVHALSGGFDETVLAGEDADYIRRVGRTSDGVRYLRVPVAITSARRLRTENPLIYMPKAVLWALLRLTGVKFSLFRYHWMQYQDPVLTSGSDRSLKW